jgi:transposase-like protein
MCFWSRKLGIRRVEFVVSDYHPGLKRAIAEVIPEAIWLEI